MNQILSTKLDKNIDKITNKNWFKFQLIFSILIISTIISCSIFYFYYLQKKEQFSNNLIDNYNIYRIYSNTQDKFYEESHNSLFRND